MKIITPEELQEWMRSEKKMLLVDVRESFEREGFNIGGIHIPLGAMMERKDELMQDIPVVVYCEKGIRSSIAIQRLVGLGFKHLYNLAGGMSAWKKKQ